MSSFEMLIAALRGALAVHSSVVVAVHSTPLPISAMPRSTLSAVLTPVSDSPSSTKVIATAGRMPTTTVSASSSRDTAAMLSSIRPMKESTISSPEMSIITPLAEVATIFSDRSSSSALARRSWMSTCMLTSSARPSFKMGMRSISRAPCARRCDRCAGRRAATPRRASPWTRRRARRPDAPSSARSAGGCPK